MARTLLASTVAFVLCAVPAFAAEPAADTTTGTVVTSTESTIVPSLAATIAADAARTPLTATTVSAAASSDWHPARPAVLPALYVGSALLQGFDAYSTLKALHLGGVEANPMMKTIVSNPAALIGVKAALTVAAITSAERMWKNHNRLGAIVTMAVSDGFMAWVAQHNAAVITGLQR